MSSIETIKDHQVKRGAIVFAESLVSYQSDGMRSVSGATRDMGTALTRICMRHRSIENRLKTLSSALLDCVVSPLHDKADEWRQKALALDKEHAKEYKRNRADIKKRSTDTVRLHKRLRKGT